MPANHFGHVVENLAAADAVLVIDETGFLKQGKVSCGVSRQYTGSAGKITNCQIGVFAAYVSRRGHAFIDRVLYLPKSWTDDPARLKAAHVPADMGIATQPQIAARMIERAIAAEVPFSWVAADTVYGMVDIERDLRCAGKGYVLGVSSTHWFGSWSKKRPIAGTAADIAEALKPADWKRLSAGTVQKDRDCMIGPISNWPISKQMSSMMNFTVCGCAGFWCIVTSPMASWRSSRPGTRPGTPINRLVAVEGHRWSIEDSFETAKNELGLDHNETRSWHGWHRHVSLVMLAFAMMATIRQRANQPMPKKTRPQSARKRPTSSAGRSRKSVA